MSIYYINDSFPLFRFNQFESHIIENISDYKRSLHLDTFSKEIVKDDSAKIFFSRDIDPSMFFYKVKNKSGYDLLNYLLNIFPTLSLSKFEMDVWGELKHLFVKDLPETDKVLLKCLLNFKLDMSFLKNEVDRLNNVYSFNLDIEKMYKDLLVSHYKYCFVTFCKSIDFKFGITIDNINYEKDFIVDFKKLKRELKRNIGNLKKVNLKTKDLVSSKIFIDNFLSSSGTKNNEEALAFLDEILQFNFPKGVERKIYNSFRNNIKLNDTSITSNKFNKELKGLFMTINKPLFYGNVDEVLDREKLRDSQKHL